MRATLVCAAAVSIGAGRPAIAQGGTFTATAGASSASAADSVFHAALVAMSQGDEKRALAGFNHVATDYPQSPNAPEAMYDAAFLMYRRYHAGESTIPLRTALVVLTAMQSRYPEAPRLADAKTLQTRVCGALAARGDRPCEQEVVRAAHPRQLAPKQPAPKQAQARSYTITVGGNPRAEAVMRSDSSACHGLNVGAVAAALNGLWKTDTAQAIGVIRFVIPNRRPCLEGLRERAILTMMGRQVPSLVPLVLDAARNDPDSAVRERATMWLTSQPRDAQLAATIADLRKRNTRPTR